MAWAKIEGGFSKFRFVKAGKADWSKEQREAALAVVDAQDAVTAARKRFTALCSERVADGKGVDLNEYALRFSVSRSAAPEGFTAKWAKAPKAAAAETDEL